jgi:dTDP-4-dehydrorhamnose 3,5-epimerase
MVCDVVTGQTLSKEDVRAMHIERLSIPDVVRVTPARFGDSRGFFSQTFVEKDFAAAGLQSTFLQDNHSRSERVGTVRGLHLQKSPMAQAKLIRVSRGRVLDVAVDVRRGSPTYGRHVTAELSAENGSQLLVPIGFLHGFVTLEPDTEVQYKVSAYYAPATEMAVLWNDPDLAIAWPVTPAEAQLSKSDQTAMRFCDFVSPFVFGE